MAPSKQSVVEFPYSTLRNISSPQDTENDRKVLMGHAPAESVLGLPTDENVRDYLLEAEGKKRRQPTQVHRAMQDTLSNNPSDFSVLNGGVVIVCRAYSSDEKTRTAQLVNPSIINGSQTQGVLRDHLNKHGSLDEPIYVTFELIVTDDAELIADTSIARNFQNDVMTVSIVGRLGQLDELEKAIQRAHPGKELRKSETKVVNQLSLTEDYVFTEKLIQVLIALTPNELWYKKGEEANPNKVYTYSGKTKCLKEFQTVVSRAKDKTDSEHARYRDLYDFYLDIAPQALELYVKWKAHQGFRGTYLRAIERDGDQIIEVPDGIIFPIIAALSAFAVKTPEGWRIQPPDKFSDDELIRAAKTTYMDTAGSNPSTMGKSKACYSAIYQIADIYKRLTV